MRNFIYAGIIMMLFSCATSQPIVKPNQLLNNQTFLLTEVSKDKSYGLTQNNPIKVGGVDVDQGPANERRFLNALAGPNGETISYSRAGSCCAFKSKNGFNGSGLLDNYRVTWEGSKDTVSIYINMYDYGSLKVPFGFTIKK